MGANMLGRSERTGVSDARVSRQQLVLFVTEAKTVVVFCLGRNPVSVKRSAAAESELVAVRGCYLSAGLFWKYRVRCPAFNPTLHCAAVSHCAAW